MIKLLMLLVSVFIMSLVLPLQAQADDTFVKRLKQYNAASMDASKIKEPEPINKESVASPDPKPKQEPVRLPPPIQKKKMETPLPEPVEPDSGWHYGN